MMEWKEVKEKWNTAKAEVKAEREAKIDAEIKFLSEKRKVELAKRADADRFAMKQKKLANLRSNYTFWGKAGKVIKSTVPKESKRRNEGFLGFGNSSGESFTLDNFNKPSRSYSSPMVRYVKRKVKKSKHKRHSYTKTSERRNGFNPFGKSIF